MQGRTKWLIMLLIVRASAQSNKTLDLDPVRDQIVLYQQRTEGVSTIMTTSNGVPVEYRDTSTLNKRLIYNNYFMNSLTDLTRSRIPERVVHAKGTGAFGYFEVTNNVTEYIKADFLSNIGKKTPVAVRFSPGTVERGGSDSTRGVHGFAVKFYTAEGNFDFVGLNTPIFPFKDPVLFPAFTHSGARNPSTNIPDPNMQWDFSTLYPETFNFLSQILGNVGLPRGYRYMSGHSIHTYQFQNKYGQLSFGRVNIIPDIGEESLKSEDVSDSNVFTRDLYEAIACGKLVSWTVNIQLMTLEEVLNSKIDVFDMTLDLPLDDFPPTTVGRLVLNRNPVNQFAEIEQLAFCPCNLVPGIDGAPDKNFEARLLVYRDAHLYRLGVNFNKIEVNCPFATIANTYNRDGAAPVRDNGRDAPNYYKNSFNGPMPYHDFNRSNLIDITEGKPDNFGQAAQIYLDLSEEDKNNLVSNIVSSLGPVIPSIQDRAVNIYTKIEPDFGDRVKKGLSEYQREPACDAIFG